MIVILTTGEKYEVHGDITCDGYRLVFFDVTGHKHEYHVDEIARIAQR